MLVARLRLECGPEAARIARAFVRSTLTGWELDGHVDDAVLVATELITNAVVHARTDVVLTLRSDGYRYVRIEAEDQDPSLPVRPARSVDSISGRGLTLIDALATAWGYQARRDGKTLWAQLGKGPDDAGDRVGSDDDSGDGARTVRRRARRSVPSAMWRRGGSTGRDSSRSSSR